MHEALRQAQLAASSVGEVPIGAVIYQPDGTILATAHNLVETLADPTAHAEVLAIQQAIHKTGRKFLEDCTIAVTLEPCAMCAQALSLVRISTIVFGAYDLKSGGTTNGARVLEHAHHKPTVLGGIEEEACRTLLQQFFQTLRHKGEGA
ncbi:MAG: nucleoside deaminase [Proteobacteria bacterium]|nr:nucleoside deaminase [Pseudomonadota bacterium]